MCAVVTDEQVRACIDAGARTVEEISDRSLACTGCGGCREHLEEMLGDGRIVSMRTRVSALPRGA